MNVLDEHHSCLSIRDFWKSLWWQALSLRIYLLMIWLLSYLKEHYIVSLAVQLINLKSRHSFMEEKSFMQKVFLDGPPKEDVKFCCFCGAYMIIINVD